MLGVVARVFFARHCECEFAARKELVDELQVFESAGHCEIVSHLNEIVTISLRLRRLPQHRVTADVHDHCSFVRVH